jgi:hypothetical protein
MHDRTVALHPTDNKTCLWKFVTSTFFEVLVTTVIAANCIAIGFEAQHAIDRSQSLALDYLEHAFTAFFLLESALRVAVFGLVYFIPNSRHGFLYGFDLVVVVATGVVPSWIMPLCGYTASSEFRAFTLLRVFRLVRIIRVVRSRCLQDVRVLLRGLVSSMRMLVWTLVVVVCMTYLFAVVGVVLISPTIQARLAQTSDDDEIAELTQLNGFFGGVTQFMFALSKVLSQDGWTDLVLMTTKYIPASWIFFYLYTAVGVLVLMNIVTAVLVDNALAQSAGDDAEVAEEKKYLKDAAMARLKRMFTVIDQDGSGNLSRQEFRNALENEEIRHELAALDIDKDNCEEVFDLIDDGDGELGIEEFFAGLVRVEGPAKAKDLFLLLTKADKIQGKVGRHRVTLTGSRSLTCSTDLGGSNKSSDQSELLQRVDEVASTIAIYTKRVDACICKFQELKDSIVSI